MTDRHCSMSRETMFPKWDDNSSDVTLRGWTSETFMQGRTGMQWAS